MESITVLPVGVTFDHYITTLSYQEKLELTKFVFGEKEEVKLVSEKLPNGQSEFKFTTYRKVFDPQDIEWTIYYILNKFNSYNTRLKPGETTWNELKTRLERQYKDKYKKRGLSDVTGPVLWPGYNLCWAR